MCLIIIQKLQEITTVSSIKCNYIRLNKNTLIHLDDCTFLIESPPGTQMQLNATILMLNDKSADECKGWLKFYDFHSNTTLVPFGE